MRKILLFLLVCFCLFACAKRLSQEVSLIAAVDGDTAEFLVAGKREKVRFLLIDTPESVKQGVAVQPYAKVASRRTKGLLEAAKKIELLYEKGRKRDKYGRLLAYVFVDGQLLEKILLSEGLARLAYYRGSELFFKDLKAVEGQARAQRRNIWSIEGYVTDKGFREP